MRRREEQRDHAAVGVPDDVRPRLEELLEPHRFVLEIDAVDLRPGREAAPVREDELEAVGERFLRRPGQLRVDDGTVHEQEARSFTHAGFRCHKVPPGPTVPRCYSRRGCRGPRARHFQPVEAWRCAGRHGRLLRWCRRARRLGCGQRRLRRPRRASSSGSRRASSPSTAGSRATSRDERDALDAAARSQPQGAHARGSAESSSSRCRSSSSRTSRSEAGRSPPSSGPPERRSPPGSGSCRPEPTTSACRARRARALVPRHRRRHRASRSSRSRTGTSASPRSSSTRSRTRSRSASRCSSTSAGRSSDAAHLLARRAGRFNPANEFELNDWISIHLGPIDMSINKAVAYLAISALADDRCSVSSRCAAGSRSCRASRQTVGEAIYELAQTPDRRAGAADEGDRPLVPVRRVALPLHLHDEHARLHPAAADRREVARRPDLGDLRGDVAALGDARARPPQRRVHAHRGRPVQRPSATSRASSRRRAEGDDSPLDRPCSRSISHVFRVISLSVRLYANMLAGPHADPRSRSACSSSSAASRSGSSPPSRCRSGSPSTSSRS